MSRTSGTRIALYHPRIGDLVMFWNRVGKHNVIGVVEKINSDRTYSMRVGADNLYDDVTYREIAKTDPIYDDVTFVIDDLVKL